MSEGTSGTDTDERLKLFSREDFDRLHELSRTNPEEFERLARRYIDDFISTCSPDNQARLRGMQFEIDAQLGRYENPVARMNKMVELFWEGVRRFAEMKVPDTTVSAKVYRIPTASSPPTRYGEKK